MNYPTEKNKPNRRKLFYGNKYLIYDIGYGEQGSEETYSIYRYYICKGRNEWEAVEDWIRQSPFKEDEVVAENGAFHTQRSWLRIVPLVSGSDEDKEPVLDWQE